MKVPLCNIMWINEVTHEMDWTREIHSKGSKHCKILSCKFYTTMIYLLFAPIVGNRGGQRVRLSFFCVRTMCKTLG